MTHSMKHQVEGPIMQEMEWTRAFGQCNSWSTLARKLGRRNDHAGGKPDPGEARGHPGPDLPYKRSPPAPVFCRHASLSFLSLCVKDRLGDQRGGSEWEPIKILLEGDWNSDKMNSLDRTPKITRSALLPFVCQNHIATGVLLVLGTNTSNLNTHTPTTAETTQKPAVKRGRLDRV
jgi:hypothetical protein